MSFETFRFWLAVAMLVDAAVGLWNEQRLNDLLPRANVRRLAFIETFVALSILAIHFFVDPR